jgi:hypothetical protein
MSNNHMTLAEQDVFYAALEGKHCAEDDNRDNGGFYMAMAREYSNLDPKLWSIFCDAFHGNYKNG